MGNPLTLEIRLAALRGKGWTVAAHNDYRLDGELKTFWLFTHPDGRYAIGEGDTDSIALSIVEKKACDTCRGKGEITTFCHDPRGRPRRPTQ
jgi:hypothetical protein